LDSPWQRIPPLVHKQGIIPGVFGTHGEEKGVVRMKPKSCETCKENESLTITKECIECVKFSNWKDGEE